MNKLTHAGYFEGIGGFSLAAERAGIETIYTCEFDDFRHDWLKYRFPHATHEKDINNATGCYADIFTAGFPCQDISNANPKGKGLQGEHSGLFFVFMRFVCIYRPKYVILENSANLVYKRYLLDILREFAKIGYYAEWQIIPKHIFSYPDERERCFLVAYPEKIGRRNNTPIFSKEYFERAKQQVEKRIEVEECRPKRMDSGKVWTSFISDILQTNTGISRKLAAQEIAAYGDAVCPDVAQLIFEMIKIYDNEKN